jgi:hypothetical protein
MAALQVRWVVRHPKTREMCAVTAGRKPSSAVAKAVALYGSSWRGGKPDAICAGCTGPCCMRDQKKE